MGAGLLLKSIEELARIVLRQASCLREVACAVPCGRADIA